MTHTYKIVEIFKEFLAHYPKKFLLLFLLLVIESLAVGISVFAVIPLADYILDPTLATPNRLTSMVLVFLSSIDVAPSFVFFGGLFIAANFLKGGLEVAVRYSILRIKYSIVRGLFGDALSVFFQARWQFFSGAEKGKILSTLNKELNTIGDTLGQITTQFAQLVQLLIYVSVPMLLNPIMTVTAISLSGLFAMPFLMLRQLGYRLGKRNTQTASNALGVFSEILQAARLVLSFGKQNEARSSYLNAWDEHTEATLRSQTLASAIPQFFKPFAMLAAIIAMGVTLDNKDGVPELAAVLWSLLAAIPIIGNLVQGSVSISNFLPSYEQLVSLRNEAAQYKELPGKRLFTKLRTGIELRDVDFCYSGRTKTLSGVSLNLKRGKMTALVGESGSGKSTIVDLVLGLQLPSSGQVLINGISLQEWQQNSFRQRIGYVPQDPILFHNSIRENLLWAQNDSNEDDLWTALTLANADNFVRMLPQGLDTIVGDRGLRLSGGQRQRIALARALLRNPELLILDEATSALDSESEILIEKSINLLSQQTTILVIAHRLSTIARSDQVYVLRAGQVVEQGAFAELSQRKGGILNRMLHLQTHHRAEDVNSKV